MFLDVGTMDKVSWKTSWQCNTRMSELKRGLAMLIILVVNVIDMAHGTLGTSGTDIHGFFPSISLLSGIPITWNVVCRHAHLNRVPRPPARVLEKWQERDRTG